MKHTPPPHAAELSIQRTLRSVEDYVREQPTKAVAAALGVGLVLNLAPPRMLARITSTLASRLLPPALLGLGVLKAFEICCEKIESKSR
ncbi:DUF883 C-terminal domain-containing protein [Prosthecobacter vanneervenii]|uniref:Uncharacterized protein n=1 Tax=Prosthecobacter vanneervenii TaxID=48466 RepID=A0A7W7Y950_9BACT|nr:DUF883 C-terminal domain-containing protein [Prosthecobacter vanneervenii]MBB5031912.1 hypothetical protein [Prosthecobacter vanneervenii]